MNRIVMGLCAAALLTACPPASKTTDAGSTTDSGQPGTDAGPPPDAGPSPDAGPGSDAGPGFDGGPTSGPIILIHPVQYLTDTTPVVTSFDMSVGPPSAGIWVDGGFVTFAGTPIDGGYEIDGVPAGDYYLNEGVSAVFGPPAVNWVITPYRNIDLTEYSAGRPDVAFADGGQTAILTLSGLSPWDPVNDTLSIASLGGNFNTTFSPAADAGATTDLENDPYQGTDWDTGATLGGLIDAASGDVTYVMQNRNLALDGGVFGTAVIAAASVSNFTEPPVATGALTATLGSPSPGSVNATVHAGAWGSVGTTSPGAVDLGTSISVYAALGNVLSPAFVSLLTLSAPPSTTDVTMAGSYVDPFPGASQELGYVSDFGRTFYTLPGVDGGTTAKAAVTSPYSYDVASTLFAQGLAPQLGPVTNLQVNGASATGSTVNGIGSTPVISWSAPAVGQPTYYQVALTTFVPTPNGRYRRQTLGVIKTTGTSVQIPPGWVVSGQAHYLHVWAFNTPNDVPLVRPFALGSIPSWGADVYSALLYP